MSAVRFRVSTSRTGHRAVVTVVVYDDVEELRRAAARYKGEPAGLLEDTQAISQPRGSVLIAADGTEKRGATTGVVRLCRGQGASILSHEMVHMALAIYRWDMGKRPLANMKNEEVLCHLVSDLVRAANKKMWDLGVYQ